MATYYYPFESHETGDENNPYDRAITAEQERMFNKLRYVNGVFNPDGGSLLVTSNNNMTVSVAAGGCHIEGAIFYSDSPITLPIEAAHSTLNRIDRIVAQFNTSDSVRAINIITRTGTAAANPVPPELRTEPNLYEIALADIYVGKNVSSVGTANITDQRLNSELCGQVVPAIPTPLDLTGIYNQYQASLNDFLGIVAAALDETLAGNLQNQITALQTDLNTEKTKIQPIELGGTGATNLVGVQDNLGIYALSPTEEIPWGADLNDYTNFGNWLCPSATIAKSLKNCPISGGGFSLRVLRGTSGDYRVQEIISSSGLRTHRMYSGTTFSVWKATLLTEHVNSPTGASVIKLWENASPTSTFSSQEINLSGYDASDYLGCIAVFNISTTDAKKIVSMSSGGWTGKIQHISNVTNELTILYLERTFVVYKEGLNSFVSFGNCNTRQGATTGESNKHLIPYKLYGIRGE